MSGVDIAVVVLAVIVVLGLYGMAHELNLASEHQVREAYRKAEVPYDDAEVAKLVEAEEAAVERAKVDDWLRLAVAVGAVPAEHTPLFCQVACEQIERAEGWA